MRRGREDHGKDGVCYSGRKQLFMFSIIPAPSIIQCISIACLQASKPDLAILVHVGGQWITFFNPAHPHERSDDAYEADAPTNRNISHDTIFHFIGPEHEEAERRQELQADALARRLRLDFHTQDAVHPLPRAHGSRKTVGWELRSQGRMFSEMYCTRWAYQKQLICWSLLFQHMGGILKIGL